MIKQSRRKEILNELEKAVTQKKIKSQTFADLQALLSSRISLNFEMMEDDIYKNHIDEGKYVFLEEHKKNFTHQFKIDAQTFGSIIESDNLLSLFLLQNTHKNKIDLIYIDPPYNNGSGFIYNNNYRVKKSERELVQVKAEHSYRHSKWLSIMKIRLEYARKLLKNTGFIVVSIDDNELYHLKLLMDDVFGADCYKGTLVWYRSVGMWTNKNIQQKHEYILIYEKSFSQSKFINKELIFKKPVDRKFNLVESGQKGMWTLNNSLDYSMICPKHKKKVWPTDAHGNKKVWTIGQKRYKEELLKNNIICEESDYQKKCLLKLCTKKYKSIKTLSSLLWKNKEEKTEPINKENKWFEDNWEFSGQGCIDLKKDIQNKYTDLFDYPKPVSFLRSLFSYLIPKNGLILDYFAGSGTTACAIAELNKIDNGKRKFILITNNDGDNRNKKNHCIFRDVLYFRLKSSKAKYDLSFKSFYIDNSKLKNLNKDDNFYSQQNSYIKTCKNLLSILFPEKDQTSFSNNIFKDDEGKKYGFFNDDLDVDMRFDFLLKRGGIKNDL